MLHNPVPSYAVQKSAERSAAGIVLFRSAHQGHENVLHNFLGGPGVSGHAQGEAVHSRLMPPVEERESLLIAFGGVSQQNVVSFLLGDPHLS
jgi:hypothetical protein